MNQTEQRTVTAAGVTVAYTIFRKNVKNINLRVKAGGIVNVSASPGVPVDYIDSFVRKEIPFILKTIEKIEDSGQQTRQRQYVTGEQMPYLGGMLTLQLEQADRRLIPEWIAQAQRGEISCFSRNDIGDAVYIRDGRLYLYTTRPNDSYTSEQILYDWQKIQTGILCRQLSGKYYPFFELMGVAWPEIRIRRMTSRWGSCIPAKHKVTFNSMLLEKPLQGIEYVVVHEFAHFIHPNHSKAFYQLVGQVLPDWKERKALL